MPLLADAVAAGNFIRDEGRPAPRSARGPFPVVAHEDCLAVIELFSREKREPEPEMLEVTTALGTLIGEFMQRLRAAEAVRHEEARKSAVLASSLDAVIVIDSKGFVTEFNPAAERISATRTDAIGSELADSWSSPSSRGPFSALRAPSRPGRHPSGRRVALPGSARRHPIPVEMAITRARRTARFTASGATQRRQHRSSAGDCCASNRCHRRSPGSRTRSRPHQRGRRRGTPRAPDGRRCSQTMPRSELSASTRARSDVRGAGGHHGRFEILDEQGNRLLESLRAGVR